MRKKRKGSGRGKAIRRKAAPILTVIFLFLALVVSVGATGYYALSPVLNERMVLKQVVVTGNKFVTSEEVFKALALEPGDSLMELDIPKFEKRLSESRFIKSAKIVRDIKPYGNMVDGTLRINVESERIPVAKAMLFERKYWLCSDGGLLLVKDEDSEARFDAARRSPVVVFHSTRQTNSASFLDDLIAVLGKVAVSAPGLISEIRLDEKDTAVLFDKANFPLKLETLENADVILANLSDILRIVAAERSKFSEAVFRASGEGILKLKSVSETISLGGEGGGR